MKEMGAMAEVPSFRVTSASVTSAAWAAEVTRNEGNSAIAPVSFILHERYRQKHALQLVLLCENRSSKACYSAKTVRYSPKKCVTTRVTLRKQCVTAFSLKRKVF